MESKSQSGFTLVELLVVIAIVCITAAIVFPAFSQAREQARKAACLSNLKQIGIADLLYDQDYDETLWSTPEPGGLIYVGFCDVPQCSGITFWTDLLMPYVKNTGVFSCPSNDEELVPPDFYNYPNNIPGSSPLWWNTLGTYPVMYGFGGNNFDPNFNIIGSGPHADGLHPAHALSDISTPAQIALFSDAIFAWNGSTCQVDPMKGGRTGSLFYAYANQIYAPYGVPLHFNGMNFVYADGHAKWCTMTPTAHPNNHPNAIGYYANARVNDQDCTDYDN